MNSWRKNKGVKAPLENTFFYSKVKCTSEVVNIIRISLVISNHLVNSIQTEQTNLFGEKKTLSIMAPTYLDMNMKVEELEIPPSPIPIHDIDYELPNPPIQNANYEIPNLPIHDSEFVSCEILPDLPDNSYENPLETGNKGQLISVRLLDVFI